MIRSIRPLLWQNTHKANSFSYEKLYHHFSSSTRLRYQTIKFSFTQTQRFTNFAKLVTKAPSTSKKNGFGSVLVGVISTIVIGTTISNNIKQNTSTQTIEEEFYALKKIVNKKVYEQKYADAEELCSQFIQNKRALQQQMPDDFSLKYYLALAEISLATLHTQQRSYNLATDELEHVIHNFSETPPPDEKNRNTEILYLSYSLKGVLDCVISDFRAAEHSFTQATQFGLQMDNIDITLVQIMFNLGNVYLELMELDKSKQAFDDALIQYKKT